MEEIDQTKNGTHQPILLGLIIIYSFLIFLSPYFIKPIITIISVILFSIVALKNKHFILYVAFLIPPILGRPDEKLFYPFQSSEIITIWIIVTGGIYFLIYTRMMMKERIFLILTALLMLQLITFVLGKHLVGGIGEIVGFMSVLAILPLSFVIGKDKEGRFLIYKLLLFSTIIPLLYGMYQKLTGDYSIESVERSGTLHEVLNDRHPIYSTFWYNHPFAKFLRTIVPLVFTGIIFNQKKKNFQVFFGIILIIIVLELVFSEARSQLIGFFLSSIVIIYALGYLKLRNIFRHSIYLIPLLILLILFTGIGERFDDLFQPIDLTSNARENSFKMRIIIWGLGLPGIIENPILGHGPGSFENDIGIISHNDYLGMWYNLGIFGTILYSSIFIYTYRKLMLYRQKITFQSWIDKSIYYSAIGLSVAIAVESLVENIFGTLTMWTIYLALISSSICIIREYNQSNSKELE